MNMHTMPLYGPSFVNRAIGQYSNDAHFTFPNSYNYPRCGAIPTLHALILCAIEIPKS